MLISSTLFIGYENPLFLVPTKTFLRGRIKMIKVFFLINHNNYNIAEFNKDYTLLFVLYCYKV